MSNELIICEKQDLVNIADAVRDKSNKDGEMSLGEIAASVNSIPKRTTWYRPPEMPDYNLLIADKSIFENDYPNQTTIHCFYTIDTKIPNMTTLSPRTYDGTFEIGHFENGEFVADKTIVFPYDLTQHEERFIILRQIGSKFSFTNKAIPNMPFNPIIEIYGRLNGINLSGEYDKNPQRLPTVRFITLFGEVKFGSLSYTMCPIWAEYIDLSHATIPDVAGRMYASNAFEGCGNLHTLLFPTDRKIATTEQQTLQYSRFSYLNNLTELDVSMWDVTGITSLQNTFRDDCSLVTLNISDWDMTSCTNVNDMFRCCFALTNLITTGAIFPSKSLSLSDSTLLTVESLLGVIAALPTLAEGTTATLTLGATNTAKLTEEQIVVATEKGWTVA